MIFLSLTGGGAFGTLQFVALQYTTAINMGVVGSVAPAFIVAASFILFGDRMGFTQLTGVAISLTGVLAIVTQLHPENLLAAQLQHRRPDHHHQHGAVGDLLRLPAPAARRAPAELPVRAVDRRRSSATCRSRSGNMRRATIWWPTRKTALAILYAAVFTTLLAYITWNRGVDLIGAPRAGAFLHTIPLFSTTLAMLFLGEQLRLYHVVGFALILSGVSLAARPAARSPGQPRTAAERQQRRRKSCRQS